MTGRISYGQIGYEAYCAERRRQGVKERFLTWDELGDDAKRAWRAAGITINTKRDTERRETGF